jgi:hypothetical protein
VAAALLGLLTIAACGGEEGEGTPTTQATTSPTSIGDEGEDTLSSEATATPTSVGEEGERTPTAEATAAPTTPAGGEIEMGIDPETTGNTASTLGDVEDCVRVDVPSPGFDGVSDYNIDVVVFGDTLAPQTYDSSLNYDNTLVHVAAPGTDEAIKLPAAFCVSDGLPDSDGTFAAGCAYLSGGPGTAGDGTLTRVGLDIDGTKSGVVTFTLNPAPQTAYGSSGPSPDNAIYHPITLGSGMLAINQDCPR